MKSDIPFASSLWLPDILSYTVYLHSAVHPYVPDTRYYLKEYNCIEKRIETHCYKEKNYCFESLNWELEILLPLQEINSEPSPALFLRYAFHFGV